MILGCSEHVCRLQYFISTLQWNAIYDVCACVCACTTDIDSVQKFTGRQETWIIQHPGQTQRRIVFLSIRFSSLQAFLFIQLSLIFYLTFCRSLCVWGRCYLTYIVISSGLVSRSMWSEEKWHILCLDSNDLYTTRVTAVCLFVGVKRSNTESEEKKRLWVLIEINWFDVSFHTLFSLNLRTVEPNLSVTGRIVFDKMCCCCDGLSIGQSSVLGIFNI